MTSSALESYMRPMIDVRPGLKYASNMRRFQGIPGIERAPNGRLWAVWYAGGPGQPGEGPGNYVVLVTSDDDGRSWSQPKLVIDPPGDFARAFDPVLWHDPRGRLWLFWAQSQGLYDGRAGVWFSTTCESGSENPLWTQPRRIANGIMMNKPITLANGEWLLPISVWSRPPGDDTPEKDRVCLSQEIGSNVWVSKDEGKSFSLRGSAQVPNRRVDEHMIVERKDGTLWMLVRTLYGIGESVSEDGGRTWSTGGPSGIPHVSSRFFVRRLVSGRLLLVRHDPSDGSYADGVSRGTRSHLTAYVSDDEGATWCGGLTLDARKSVSYPDGVQAPDGTIYMIYDRGRARDGEILLAVFTEEDVTAGHAVSSQARFQVLVDKASFNPPQGSDVASASC